MIKEIDCRGLACPSPVLQTKKAIEREHASLIRVIVDNQAAKQNVSRFLQSQEFDVTVEGDGKLFHVLGRGRQGTIKEAETLEKKLDAEEKKIMVMMATDRMGFGDDELGKKLIVNFISTLKEMGHELWRLVLVNNGVKLTIADSPVLSDLKGLQKDGVTILVCGTCLEHFQLLEKKLVGETTNMLDIVTAMQVADKVINI